MSSKTPASSSPDEFWKKTAFSCCMSEAMSKAAAVGAVNIPFRHRCDERLTMPEKCSFGVLGHKAGQSGSAKTMLNVLRPRGVSKRDLGDFPFVGLRFQLFAEPHSLRGVINSIQL